MNLEVTRLVVPLTDFLPLIICHVQQSEQWLGNNEKIAKGTTYCLLHFHFHHFKLHTLHENWHFTQPCFFSFLSTSILAHRTPRKNSTTAWVDKFTFKSLYQLFFHMHEIFLKKTSHPPGFSNLNQVAVILHVAQ